MEDDKSTATTEEVDTSTNEEAQDTDVEKDLENDDISFEDADDDETEEPEESEDDKRESEEDSEEEPKEDEGKQSLDKESKEDDTPSKEEQKRRNDEFARQRIADREAREATKRQQQDKYLEAAEDNRDLALRQLQIDAYNNRVDANLNKLENGLERAVASIDLFHKGSDVEKEELAKSLEDFERIHVKRDANGDPVDVSGDVYQFLQAKAESIKRLTGVGARNQTNAKNNAKSRTDTIPTRRPKETKKDPDLEGFDEEADRW